MNSRLHLLAHWKCRKHWTCQRQRPVAQTALTKTRKAPQSRPLGGRPSAQFAGGIPAADAALIARVSRNGVAADIRATLAAEDARFRANRKRLSLFNPFARNRYFRAYAAQALDAYAELQRFRNLGVATPTAPPAQ